MTLEQLARQGRRTSSMTTASTITSKMSQIRKESIKQAFCDFENIKIYLITIIILPILSKKSQKKEEEDLQKIKNKEHIQLNSINK